MPSLLRLHHHISVPAAALIVLASHRMNRHCGQEWWSTARFTIRAGTFYLVELRGLEPLTPCLQIAVTGRVVCHELACCVFATDLGIPALAGVNGTLMARSGRHATCGAARAVRV